MSLQTSSSFSLITIGLFLKVFLIDIEVDEFVHIGLDERSSY